MANEFDCPTGDSTPISHRFRHEYHASPHRQTLRPTIFRSRCNSPLIRLSALRPFITVFRADRFVFVVAIGDRYRRRNDPAALSKSIRLIQLQRAMSQTMADRNSADPSNLERRINIRFQAVLENDREGRSRPRLALGYYENACG